MPWGRAGCWYLSTYVYRHKHLEVNFLAWTFSKITIAGSPLVPVSFMFVGFGSDFPYQTWTSSCGVGLKVDQKAFGQLHNSIISITTVGTFCLTVGIMTRTYQQWVYWCISFPSSLHSSFWHRNPRAGMVLPVRDWFLYVLQPNSCLSQGLTASWAHWFG